MSDLIAVVGVALLRDGPHGTELLAARRVEPPELAGGWELPGGKVDPGETAEEAAHREIDEELGVDIELGIEIVGPDEGAWRLSPHHRMRVFLARVVQGQEPIARAQHDALMWLPAQEWNSVGWLDGDIEPVRAIISTLGGTA